MKNVTLKPLDKMVLPPYGLEDPELGAKWVPDAKVFFGRYPIASQLSSRELLEVATNTFPSWFTDGHGEPKELTSGQIVDRLNMGGGNKNFGEPRLQLYYDRPSRSYLVIDAMELVDQINVAEVMASTGQRAKGKLNYALRIATSQMKLELSAEQQQQVLEAYAAESEGVRLMTKWADRRTLSLAQAVHEVLPNSNNAEGRNKK